MDILDIFYPFDTTRSEDMDGKNRNLEKYDVSKGSKGKVCKALKSEMSKVELTGKWEPYLVTISKFQVFLQCTMLQLNSSSPFYGFIQFGEDTTEREELESHRQKY